MHKFGDSTAPATDGDHAASLAHAHRLIQKLAGHIGVLTKRLDAHASKLATHDGAHNTHSQIHGDHETRIAKLEADAGMPSAHGVGSKVYRQSAEQLKVARDFFNKDALR